MILGIGTDIIDVERIKAAIAKDAFKQKVYSQREIDYCDAGRKEESYAVRFAAKEAFFKALGTGWEGDMLITEVEVVNDKAGKPEIILSGEALRVFKEKGGAKVHVSLSHDKQKAVAFVVIESI